VHGQGNNGHWISVSMDPNGVREVTIVSAMVPGHSWLSPGPSPSQWVPGAFVSLVVSTYAVSFTDVELTSNGVDPVIILNGSLSVRQKQ